MSVQAFAGKNALVTGGGRGIGRATALRLASEGANVAVSYAARREEAESAAAEIKKLGVKSAAFQADVAEQEEAQRLAAHTRKVLGPIDILVHCGAICVNEPVDEVTWEVWKRTFDVNVHGTFHMIYAVKDEMIERGFGRIVTIASIAGLRPRPRLPHYAASKAAVISMTQSLSVAWAPHNVRLNCVAPGLIDTEMARDLPRDSWEQCLAETPMGRVGEAGEIANLVRFLASEESSFMAGQTLVASGGRVLLP
jgi:3-oxoacyl-[acyl-carrier protein] reductase